MVNYKEPQTKGYQKMTNLKSESENESNPVADLFAAAVVIGVGYLAYKGLKWLFSQSEGEDIEPDEDIKKDISEKVSEIKERPPEPNRNATLFQEPSVNQPNQSPSGSYNYRSEYTRRDSHDFSSSS